MWDYEDATPISLDPAPPSQDDYINAAHLSLPESSIFVSPPKAQRKRRKTGATASARPHPATASTQPQARPHPPAPPNPLDTPSDSLDLDGLTQSHTLDATGRDSPPGELDDIDYGLHDSPRDATADVEYEEFAEGVSLGTIGFYQISKTLFVCEGSNGSGADVRM